MQEQRGCPTAIREARMSRVTGHTTKAKPLRTAKHKEEHKGIEKRKNKRAQQPAAPFLTHLEYRLASAPGQLRPRPLPAR
jgi:hypothetical protein